MKEKYVNLNKVYTKRGDTGDTDLFGGSKAAKDSDKVDAYGSIDEVGSFLGLVRLSTKDEAIKQIIFDLQSKFLVIGGILASDSKGIEMLKEKITLKDIENIENVIDEYNSKLPSLFKFLIPGEDYASTYMHISRTVIRRAERRIVTLLKNGDIDPLVLKFVNRSSDLLFVLSRYEEEINNPK